MQSLPSEVIAHLLDMLIIPPSDYVTIFLLNRYWRECTELDKHFWERQLCGLLFIFVRNEKSGSEYKDLVSFYRSHFFDSHSMAQLFNSFGILRSIFKPDTRRELIRLVDNNSDQHIWKLYRNIFITCYNRVCTSMLSNRVRNDFDMDTKFNMRKLGIYNCEYFKTIDDLDYHLGHVKQMTTSVDCSHHWNSILKLDSFDSDRLQQLQISFLQRIEVIFSERHAFYQFAAVFGTLCVHLEEIERGFREKNVSTELAVDSLFTVISKIIQKQEKKERPIVFKKYVLLFFNEKARNNVIYFNTMVTILEEFRQRFIEYYNMGNVLDLFLWKTIHEFNITDESIILIKYLLDTYQLTSKLFKVLFGYNPKVNRLYYQSKNAQPTVEHFEFSDSVGDSFNFLDEVHKIYLKTHKNDKQFWKDILKKFNAVYHFGDEMNTDRNIVKLFELLSNCGSVTKNEVNKYKKKLFSSVWEQNLNDLRFSIDDEQQVLDDMHESFWWTKFFETELKLELSQVESEVTMYFQFSPQDLELAHEALPKKVLNQEFIPFHHTEQLINPLCLFILNNRCNLEILQRIMKEECLRKTLTSTINVPYLYDLMSPPPVVSGKETVTCVSYLSYKFRLFQKRTSMKQLLTELIENIKRKHKIA